MPDLSYGFTLPNYGNPIEALQQAGQQQERKAERKAQNAAQAARQAELDNAGKIKMIEDYTNPTKYQTGEAISLGLATQKAGEIKKKWTDALKANPNLSLTDLYSGLGNDTTNLISGVESLKQELSGADKTIADLKQKYPDLDTNGIMQKYREDILHRRIDNGNNFMNPLQVPQSQFANNLNNPDFLSMYAKKSDNLNNEIINPKGVETLSVFSGRPNDAHTKFEAKVPYWRKENFDRNLLSQGFLPNGSPEPSLDLKASVLPATALPSSNGQPFNIIDKDVFDRFTENPSDPKSVELIAATRNKYPNYDKFNTTEKEYAKRNVLYDKIKALDQSQYHPTATFNAPKTTNNINMGGGVEKKKQDDYDLVASLARTFNNPSSINTQNLTQTKVKGFDKPLYDLTGVFQNLKVRNAKDFNQIGDQINKDVNLDALYIDPSNNNMVFKFPTKKDAESVMGRNMKYNEGYVMIPTSDKKSMKAAINSIATAYNFKENQRKQLVNMVQGAESTTNKQQPKAAPQPASKPAKGKQSEADKLGI